MIALIINFNRITLTVKTCDWIFNHGITPVIVDNNSSYRPLLEYYKTCPYQVVRLDRNYGHKVIWDCNILERLGITGQYIVTDPDLDLSGIPDDFLSVLQEGLRRYPQAEKCGFSLDYNDLPVGDVRDWEMSLWREPLDDMYFKAGIDTTFALYREDSRHYQIWNSIRTNKPYMACHVPWSYKHIKDLPADEKYYVRTASKSFSGKERIKL
jgi:hypothetical protein